ncbi:YdaS family helix-turn-helix protein [Stenotrophomonas sp.]|uniref:transcriptional regulator n=1 Tax=Stenotrophomonas sp. TaxID=69392 RepID=UPI0028B21DAF|nr:YdaS family helix-turn-helix protein [Stenotrophomonas sp.]
MTALDKAVTAAGSQLALACLLGIKAPSVSGWYDRKRVPAERCIAIEKATGVSRHELRPDVFGPGTAVEVPVQPQQTVVEQIRAEVDSRMSKRALRAKLGVSNDKQLAKVLQLPVDQVEAWPEEKSVPSLPQVMRLLGVQEESQAPSAPADPDEDRIIPVEAA